MLIRLVTGQLKSVIINQLQEAKFISSKRTAGEKIKESLQRSHEENLARLDRQFLNELHDLRRNVESALWEQERNQMDERFKLRRQQLKVRVVATFYHDFN